jgi:hypothetical protein
MFLSSLSTNWIIMQAEELIAINKFYTTSLQLFCNKLLFYLSNLPPIQWILLPRRHWGQVAAKYGFMWRGYESNTIIIILFFNVNIHQLVVMKSGARVSVLLVWLMSRCLLAISSLSDFARLFAFYVVSIFAQVNRITYAYFYIGINTYGWSRIPGTILIQWHNYFSYRVIKVLILTRSTYFSWDTGHWLIHGHSQAPATTSRR